MSSESIAELLVNAAAVNLIAAIASFRRYGSVDCFMRFSCHRGPVLTFEFLGVRGDLPRLLTDFTNGDQKLTLLHHLDEP